MDENLPKFNVKPSSNNRDCNWVDDRLHYTDDMTNLNKLIPTSN